MIEKNRKIKIGKHLESICIFQVEWSHNHEWQRMQEPVSDEPNSTGNYTSKISNNWGNIFVPCKQIAYTKQFALSNQRYSRGNQLCFHVILFKHENPVVQLSHKYWFAKQSWIETVIWYDFPLLEGKSILLKIRNNHIHLWEETLKIRK